MLINSLLNSKSELTNSSVTPKAVALSTRIRLARNLNNFSFPGWADKDRRSEILAMSQEVIRELPEMENARIISIKDLSELEKQILMERRLISRELCSIEEGSGVIISKDQSCSIMINEEDHLRIQVIRSGFNFRHVWKTIDRLDSEMEESLNFAFSSNWGYLTACPSNIGTGMRASIMMHLPGLVITNQMEKVIRAVNQLGIVVRGIFGEGSEASGSIFQISNQQTLGESEADILKNLNNILHTIIEQEHNARDRLLATDSAKLFDKIGRAYGILQNAHHLSSEEAMNLLSLIRLGIDLEVLPKNFRRLVDRLFIECQPGHIQFTVQKNTQTTAQLEQRDFHRAEILRKQFTNIPPLDFEQTISHN